MAVRAACIGCGGGGGSIIGDGLGSDDGGGEDSGTVPTRGRRPPGRDEDKRLQRTQASTNEAPGEAWTGGRRRSESSAVEAARRNVAGIDVAEGMANSALEDEATNSSRVAVATDDGGFDGVGDRIDHGVHGRSRGRHLLPFLNLCTENPQSSAKGEEENMLRNYDDHGGVALEELSKQRTFTRSEFEYLADLLWSKTIGANSLKPEDGNIRKTILYDKENGSKHSNLPLDFSTTTCSVDDQVASPAEIAKAYMGSKSSKGPPLRLRLHDPSSMTTTYIEASMSQKTKPTTIPPAQGSRLHTSKTSDRLESNYTTQNGAIFKISPSPYFKSAVSSKELFGSVSSHYQTSSSVHTFGRQHSCIVNQKVLKRNINAVSNESVSAGHIRRMHQRYNRKLPLLETRLCSRRYPLGYGRKFESPEQLAQTQKRRCLDKVGDASLGSIDDSSHVNCFGLAPEQSAA